MPKRPFSFILLIPALLSGALHGLVAQDFKQYSGPYDFNGYRGAAEFEFESPKRNDTLLAGDFDFTYKQADSTGNYFFNKIRATGQYDAGMKTGSWNYFSSENEISIEDVTYFNVKTKLTSLQRETTAQYNDKGLPAGTWTYTISHYANETIREKLSSGNLQFEDGYIKGPIAFKTDPREGYLGLYGIRGQTTNEGLMDGKWEFEYVRDTIPIVEHRFYTNGFLTEVIKMHSSKKDTLVDIRYLGTIDRLSILDNGGTALFKVSEKDFDEEYAGAFDGADARALTQLHGNNYLNILIDDIIKFDLATYFEDDDKTIHPLKTKRFEFVVLDHEDSLRAEINADHLAIQERIAEFKQSNTLALNLRRSDSLYYAYQYFILVDSLLERLNSNIEIATSDDYKYFDTFYFLKSESFGYMTSDTLYYRIEGVPHVFSVDFNKGLDPNATYLERLNHYTSRMNENTARLMEMINFELQQLEINFELETLQASILERRARISDLIRRRDFISEEERNLFHKVEEVFFEQKFEKFTAAYAADEFEESRTEKAENYLVLLDELESMIRPLSLVYENQKRLDKLYIEEVFNPFTYTSYERRVKEDLYENYMLLFKHYIASFQNIDEAREFKEIIRQIAALQMRMEKLRYQDTRGYERKLRGAKNWKETESILGLSKSMSL